MVGAFSGAWRRKNLERGAFVARLLDSLISICYIMVHDLQRVENYSGSDGAYTSRICRAAEGVSKHRCADRSGVTGYHAVNGAIDRLRGAGGRR